MDSSDGSSLWHRIRLGLRAARCRFGATQPAAVPSTPAPRSLRNLLSHLAHTSRLTAGCLGESGSRLHAVHGAPHSHYTYRHDGSQSLWIL